MAETNMMLVEGPDDWNVFYHLIKQHYSEKQVMVTRMSDIRPIQVTVPAGSKHIQIDVVKSDSYFKPKSLSAKLKASELERIGLVVDADTDLKARWLKLRDALATNGYEGLPAVPDVGGMVIEQEGYPTVGVWIMPDNQLPGKIEDFIAYLRPESDTLWTRAQEAVEQIPSQERRFKPQSAIKAAIHTWLAWQEEPGTPMGQAITKHYLDASAPQAMHLLDWLRRLFDLGTA